MTHPFIPQIAPQPPIRLQTPLTLREGQMFKGHIKQFFPGNLAEVQIGQHKLMAKLEVPMKAGEAYYFQVKAVEPELQLKIISGPIQAQDNQSNQLANLVDRMQLQHSKEMQSVLAHFIKNKIPFTRENLIDATKLLKSVPVAVRGEALQMIQKLMQLRLPLTSKHFSSLMSVEMKEGFHQLLQALQVALDEELGLQPAAKHSILSTLESLSGVTKTAMDNALLHHAVVKLLDDTLPQQERFQILQLLKSVGLLPKQASMANLHTTLTDQLIGQVESQIHSPNGQLNRQEKVINKDVLSTNQTIIDRLETIIKNAKLHHSTELIQSIRQFATEVQQDTVLEQPQKQQMMKLLVALEKLSVTELPSSPITAQLTKILVKHMAEQGQKQPFDVNIPNAIHKLFGENALGNASLISQRIAQLNVPITNQLLQEAQTSVSSAIDGKTMQMVMQSITASLGVNYEATIGHQQGDFPKNSEWLKPQLVALLQDPSISTKTRDVAEMIVTRMNGHLLHSGEVGLNQQIVMQLPMSMLGQRIDATLQWNGRMKDDGKIDPEFARIMFYLELSSLDKTVVDMQVQNRIVTLTIYNEEERLKMIGDLFRERLKEGLTSSKYILSGVSFKKFEESTETAIRQQEIIQEHQGVDFRI